MTLRPNDTAPDFIGSPRTRCRAAETTNRRSRASHGAGQPEGGFRAAALIPLDLHGVSDLCIHTREVVRKHRENGTTDWIEIGNIVLDVIHHVVLTWMSLPIPSVWSPA